MQFKRSERVSELLRHEISKLVQEIQNPKLGFVTITAVKVSDDLSEAKVFYSVYGSEEEKKISGEILIRAVSFIRHSLGKRLESLKKVPTLKFIFDTTLEQAQRINSILNQIAQERTDDPAENNSEQKPQ